MLRCTARLGVFCSTLLIVGCAGGEHGLEHDEDSVLDGHDDDHSIPQPYKDMTSPFAGEHDAAEAGLAIYDDLCAGCHGLTGAGDGEGGHGLVPAPSNFQDPHVSGASDDYLMYRISEGGGPPFDSTMPSFSARLAEDQRWQVIEYVRTLAVAKADAGDDADTDDGHDES